MILSRIPTGRFVSAALLVVTGLSSVRAADDFVEDDEPAPPPVQQPALGGQLPGGGRVIVMPGFQVQFGGPGQMQLPGGFVVPQPVVPPGAEVRPAPFLGVVAGPVMPQVRAQLDLPEGVGLSIDAVTPGGPADRAGVKQFDVIHKFNDQVVCSPEQLTTLVKVVGAGTKVSLTIQRGGHERVLEAVIEERAVPAVAAGVALQGVPDVLELQRLIAPGLVPGVQGNLRAQVLSIGPDAQSATVVSDARGTVEIRASGGTKTVTVKDASGREVHSGPLDTDDDLEQVPAAYRDWVREIDAGQTIVEQRGAPDPEQPAPAAADGPRL